MKTFVSKSISDWTEYQNPKPELVPSPPPLPLPSSVTFFTSTSNINNSVNY